MKGLPLSYVDAVEAFKRWCDLREMDSTDTELRCAFIAGVVHVEGLLGLGEEE